MKHRCRIYGLNISSDLPLYQLRPVPAGAGTDVEILLGVPIPRADDSPGGRSILHLQTSKQHYTVNEIEGGTYIARFYGSCDIRFDPALSRMTVHPVDGVDTDLLSVLVAGTAMAVLLTMRGEAVLHASAVQVDQGAVAFVGASGMGKSTMAALFSARGALLVTDDLLRVSLGGDQLTCALGATEVRLRKSVGDLIEQFEVAPGRRSTGDARDALATTAAVDEDIPLQAIVVSIPDKSGATACTSLTPLPSAEALLLLSRFPRLLGWEDTEATRRQFDQLADIVTRVPVYIAELPWGPPFPADLVDAVLAQLGMSVDGSRDIQPVPYAEW